MTTRLLFAFTLIWCAAAAPAAESSGDAKDPQRDLTSVKIDQAEGDLVVTASVAQDWNFDAVQIFLDTDSSPASGYRVPGVKGMGADLMAEGANLFKHGGKPDDWTWQQVGSVRRKVEGRTLVTAIDADRLGGAKQVRLVFRTLTSNFQEAADVYPNDDPQVVAIQPAGAPTEKAGDATDGWADVVSVAVTQDGGDVILQAQTREPSDFNTLLVFLDTDRKGDTGYQPPADGRYGFEMLIQGTQLLKHAGPGRDAWNWTPAGTVGRTADGTRLTLKFDAGLLGSTDVGVGAWVMSKDWQTLLDQAPGRGLYELKIDAAKLRAPPKPAAMAPPKAKGHLPARQRVREAESYYCYYGAGRVAELSHYDVVILHTPQMRSEDVKALSARGVVTIGYISVGEDAPEMRKGDGTGPGGYASWYFDRDKDNLPDKNKTWNSYFCNANDPKWRADRVAEARRLVEQWGFDGIFLDTLDTAALYAESQEGMVQLVRDLRSALPNAPIVLNQGYILLPKLAPIADALMLESFTATYDFESGQYLMNYPSSIDYHLGRINKEVLPVLREQPLRVFVLDYAPKHERERIQQAANRAVTFGFLFAAAPIFLDDVYPNDIVGKPDEKWLKKMATPESMSVTLDKPANGFPAGTRVLPSSCFGGYTVAAVVDGIEDRSTLHWSKAAWASAEDGDEAFLEFRLPEPRRGGALAIRWAVDSAVVHCSRDYRVEVRGSDGEPWRILHHVRGNAAERTRHELPEDGYRQIRIIQPPDGGSAARPNLMWIAQVALE